MTSHQLARVLLAGPDLPVVINGWATATRPNAPSVAPRPELNLEVYHGGKCGNPITQFACRLFRRANRRGWLIH